jgi:hypothetical protein
MGQGTGKLPQDVVTTPEKWRGPERVVVACPGVTSIEWTRSSPTVTVARADERGSERLVTTT